MRIENFAKPKQCDHSPKQDESIDPLTYCWTVPLKDLNLDLKSKCN